MGDCKPLRDARFSLHTPKLESALHEETGPQSRGDDNTLQVMASFPFLAYPRAWGEHLLRLALSPASMPSRAAASAPTPCRSPTCTTTTTAGCVGGWWNRYSEHARWRLVGREKKAKHRVPVCCPVRLFVLTRWASSAPKRSAVRK